MTQDRPPRSADHLDLRELFRAAGVSDADVDQAEMDGMLPLLAFERLSASQPNCYDLTELAAATGMPATQIAQLWRSLGFTEPRPGDRIFTKLDVEMLRTVANLIALGVIEPVLTLQMSRVIGSSLARVALAQIDAVDPGDEAFDDEEAEAASDDPLDIDEPAMRAAGGLSPERARRQEAFTEHAGDLLSTLPKIMDAVWRRHLQAAARQRMNREAAGADRDRLVVGFADLVGFTVLSQQITPRELAAVVDRFETIAYDTVGRIGGRVVKMIGDEVMFTVDDDVAAAEIALTLAEAYAADDDLSDVRVGLAAGPVLQREADVFGPVVNLASRIVGIAFPASVVVDESVYNALADNPNFVFKAIGRRRLKDIGRVHLWVAHRAAVPQAPKSALQAARADRAERRERTVERLASTHVEHHRLKTPWAKDE